MSHEVQTDQTCSDKGSGPNTSSCILYGSIMSPLALCVQLRILINFKVIRDRAAFLRRPTDLEEFLRENDAEEAREMWESASHCRQLATKILELLGPVDEECPEPNLQDQCDSVSVICSSSFQVAGSR